MTRRGILPRLAGAAMIVAGWGSCLWLRALIPGTPHDPTLLELALVVTSFVLTLGGTLLVLHGDKLWNGFDAKTGPHRIPPRPDASTRRGKH